MFETSQHEVSGDKYLTPDKTLETIQLLSYLRIDTQIC